MNDSTQSKESPRPPRRSVRVRNGIGKSGDGYVVVLREPNPVTGKTKPVWHSGFPDRKSAEAFRDERRVAIRRHEAVAKSSLTVGAYLAEWMPAHFTNRQLKPSTQESYREQVDGYIVPRIGNVRLQDLTPAMVERLYNDLLTSGGRGGGPLSLRTVEMTGTILRMALQRAVTVHKYIPSNPAAAVRIPRPRRSPKDTWTAVEMRRIVEAAREHPLGPLFILAAATGARRGELLALRWSNVDAKARTITFERNRVGLRSSVQEGTLKNDEVKTVTIDAGTMAVLQAHRKSQAKQRLAALAWHDGNYVFCNDDGSPLHPRTPNRIWKAIIEKAGVKYLKPHAMRHTHATLLLEAGVPLHVVAKRLGHKDPMVTATIYASVTARQEDAAAGVYDAWLNPPEEAQEADQPVR